MPETYDYVIKQGDQLPDLEATLVDADEAAVDVSGATIVFRAVKVDDESVKFSGAGSLGATPSSGEVSYAWDAADTAEPGVFNCEWEITIGGKTRTIPEQAYFKLLITEVLPE